MTIQQRDQHAALLNAIYQYDAKERKAFAKNNRHYWNPFAYSLCLDALDTALRQQFQLNITLRQALTQNFTGRLLDKLLVSVGELKSTDQEQFPSILP